MSSTNKTENLALNLWVPDDPPLREDFNSDNAKIDAAIGALMDVTDGLPDRKPGFAAYTSPGTYLFTAPKTTNYIVEVAGGGGLSGNVTFGHPYYYGGGGGGYAKKLVPLTKGDTVTVTVGAAALNGLNPSYSVTEQSYSGAGGASSFGEYVTAPGGSGSSGGIPTTGDLNIPGSGGGEEPDYVPGVSFLGSSSSRRSSGVGAGNNYRNQQPGQQSGATCGCCLITWM